MSVESIASILSTKEVPAIQVEAKAETTGETTTPPVVETQKVETEKPETKVEKSEKARDENGKFAKVEKTDKPTVDVAGIIDERRKRQALEKELEALRGTKPAELPSVFDNEDAAIKARVADGTKDLREKFYKLSVKAAQKEHGEAFTDAATAFSDAAERDPRLFDGLRSADDPGEYILLIGTQIKELADVGGDFMKYREKVTGELGGKLTESETRAKALETEVETLKKRLADFESLPRSLNSNPSGVAKAGAEDAEDIKSITRFGKPTH